MSEFKLTSVEEFEQATNELLETGAKVGADAWQFRVKTRPRTVNSVSREPAAVSVRWDLAVLHQRHREESADAMYTVL